MTLTENSPIQQPAGIVDEQALDGLLATPSLALVQFFTRLRGDLIMLGTGGKMGVSLAALAVNAARQAHVPARIIGVSRFAEKGPREQLEQAGVETIACDLTDWDAVAALPRAANVICLAGRKFGTADHEDETWAVNVALPALVAEHFASSRIVAFSSGCVYPLLPASSGGSKEQDALDAVGEYAQSCVGRERVWSYYSRKNRTPLCLYRLNYATDLRYGVLHDIALKVWTGQPVDLNVGYFNTIWQGDANQVALQALELAAVPPAALNVTGPELLSTRAVAETFGRLMNRKVNFTGTEGGHNYLSNAARCHARFGLPALPAARLIEWQAHWIMAGQPTLGKPTHFEVSNGRY